MIEDALLSIGLLIVVAKLVEGALRRFRVNAIVAYTATGILLGPVAQIIHPTGEIQILLGIGIFLLFFLIGLDELDISGFMAAVRGRYFVAATLSILIPILAAMAVTSDVVYDFGLGLRLTESIALAGILSLTSLGLAAKVLVDEGHLREPIGIRIFTTALIAELLALLLVGFAIGDHSEGAGWSEVLVLLAQIAGFTVVTWILASRVIPPAIMLLQRLLYVPQLSFGLVLGGLFLTVVGAEKMGLHGSLGALLFGAALSGMPHQVRRDIAPGMRSVAEGLFVPLFFAAAGLHMSLSFTELPALTIAALVVVPLIGKFAGALIGALVARLDTPFALATGLMAKGVAEVALLLVLLETGVIGRDLFSLLVLIMFGYILLTPPAINLVIRRTRSSASPDVPDRLPPSLVRFALNDISVGDVLDLRRGYPDPSLSVRAFADRWIVPHQQDYVIADKGELAGIVSLGMLRYVPKESWTTTPLSRIVRRNPPVARPEEPVEDVLQRMTEKSLTVLPVVEPESGKFVGVITSQEILDLIISEARGEP